jgi:hypothetical protein
MSKFIYCPHTEVGKYVHPNIHPTSDSFNELVKNVLLLGVWSPKNSIHQYNNIGLVDTQFITLDVLDSLAPASPKLFLKFIKVQNPSNAYIMDVIDRLATNKKLNDEILVALFKCNQPKISSDCIIKILENVNFLSTINYILSEIDSGPRNTIMNITKGCLLDYIISLDNKKKKLIYTEAEILVYASLSPCSVEPLFYYNHLSLDSFYGVLIKTSTVGAIKEYQRYFNTSRYANMIDLLIGE